MLTRASDTTSTYTRFILSVFSTLNGNHRIIYNIFMGIMILSAIQSQWYISVCHKFLSRMNLRSHNLNHTWIAFDEERSTLLSLSMKDISIRKYWNKGTKLLQINNIGYLHDILLWRKKAPIHEIDLIDFRKCVIIWRAFYIQYLSFTHSSLWSERVERNGWNEKKMTKW